MRHRDREDIVRGLQARVGVRSGFTFGGVIGVNRVIDSATAEEMAKLFLEVVAALGFDEAAKAKFAAKKTCRLVEVAPSDHKWALKNVSGGNACAGC